MPMFLSKYARQSLVYRQGGVATRVGKFGAEEQVVTPTLKARFSPLTPPFSTNLIPGKGGLARGILDTRKVAVDFRARAAEFGEKVPTDEESHEAVLDWLRKHPSNAANLHNGGGIVLFAEVPEESEESVGSATAVVPIDPSSNEAFEVSGDQLNCLVCGAVIDKRGKAGHLRSKKHLEAAQSFDRRRRATLGV